MKTLCLFCGLIMVIAIGCTQAAPKRSPATRATVVPQTPAPAAQAGGVRSVSAEEFERMRREHGDYVVLDVRTPAEFASGHLAGAINMNVNDPAFAQKMASLDRSKTYLVYCRTGRRSATACERLGGAGMTGYNLQGGIVAWSGAGLPTTRPSASNAGAN